VIQIYFEYPDNILIFLWSPLHLIHLVKPLTFQMHKYKDDVLGTELFSINLNFSPTFLIIAVCFAWFKT